MSDAPQFKYLPPSPLRGTIGLFGIALFILGAGALWGAGAFLMAFGFVLWIESSSDEAVERLSRTKRGKPEAAAPTYRDASEQVRNA